jgi:hypothetical protein
VPYSSNAVLKIRSIAGTLTLDTRYGNQQPEYQGIGINGSETDRRSRTDLAAIPLTRYNTANTLFLKDKI